MNPALPSNPADARFYIAGGTLCTDAPCYVVREADEKLFRALREGQFAYVLTSRQMGKSSLMVRTAARLRGAGITVAIADLSAIGQNLTADQWYYGLAEHIAGQCGFDEGALQEIWGRNPHHPSIRRWILFIEELLDAKPHNRLVIFIDEIDTVRSLPFSTDEFFASIRSFYNQRAIQSIYGHVTFCLLGVAAPIELIRNPLTTPFNIGTRIELNDFGEREAAPLAGGLGRGEAAVKRLRRILYWTGGHPFLTQRLCQAVAAASEPDESVDDICKIVFLGNNALASDENLAFVREYLLHKEGDIPALLKLYRQIRLGRNVADSETDARIAVLRLSGICRARDGHLQVGNRIYKRVFDERWIRMSMPDAELRRQRTAFRRGFALATMGTAIILAAVAFLTYDVFQQRNQNRWQLYIANVGLAAQAWEDHDTVRATELLRSVMPRPGQRDLRGLEWYGLWNLTQAEHPSVSIREGMLRNPVLSKDGRQVFATGPDAVLEFDAQSGHLIRRLFAVPHDSYPTLGISPDGKTLAARGLTRFTTMDLSVAGALQTTEVKPRDWPIPANFLARLDANVSQHCTWTVFWPASEWELLQAHSNITAIRCATLSPDGQYMAVTIRNSVEIWSMVQAKKIVSVPTDQPAPVAFSADSRYFAWGEYGPIHILDLHSKHIIDLPPHHGLVYSVAFSPDGKWLASAGQDEVRLWDLDSGRVIRSLGRYAGNATVEFFPDSSELLVGGRLGIDIWDLRQRQPNMAGADEIYTLAFSPGKAILASGGGAGQLVLWNADTHERQSVLDIGERIDSVSFLDSRSVIVNTLHHVAIWDLAEGRPTSVMADSPSRVLAALSPDHKTVAITDTATRELKVVDLATRRVLYHRLLDSAPGALVFAGDSRTLAVSLADQRVEVISASSLVDLRGSGFGRALAFSPNARQLLVGYDEAQICAWDWRRRQRLAILEGHTAPIKSIEFSPDGSRVISASDDGTVRVWDAAAYQPIVVFRESERSMETIAFSPDSRFFAAAGDNRIIRLWDARRIPAR